MFVVILLIAYLDGLRIFGVMFTIGSILHDVVFAVGLINGREPLYRTKHY